MDNNMIFRTLLIIVAAFVLFALVNFYNNKQTSVKAEKFYQDNFSSELLGDFQPKTSPAVVKPAVAPVKEVNSIAPSEPLGNEDYRAIDFQTNKLPNDCFPKDRLTADDLLPKDAANSKWAQVNPAGQGDVKDQNYLTAGYMVGINTVGSSLKNANLQLRSEPVIPKMAVGPFLNSSYEASDALRRPLEIGGDC